MYSLIWWIYIHYFNTFSYSTFVELKISVLDKFLESLLGVDVGKCWIMWGRWLEDVLTCNRLSLGFLWGLYIPLDKLKGISGKSTTLRLVFISILKPISLNILIVSFLILSVCKFCPFVFYEFVRELVGTLFLSTLANSILKEKSGLYRHDGLILMWNENGQKMDRIRKEVIKIVKEIGFKIEIKSNLKVVDFLDITFDLSNGT